MFEDFLIKYAWGALGLGLCSIPVFLPGIAGRTKPEEGETDANAQVGARTRGFITNKR